MPISHTDYEMPVETDNDARGTATPLARLVKQTKKLHEWMVRQISASRETAGASTSQHGITKSHGSWIHRQEMENPIPQDRVLNQERVASKATPEPDAPLPNGGKSEPSPTGFPQAIPSGLGLPEEQGENAVPPELPGGGHDLQNRFDAAQGLIRGQTQNGEELQTLLDQAITLLESVSQHPAIRDYNANKLKLDEIEQRLGYGAYPQ